MSKIVKGFDSEEIKRLIRRADPTLRDYIRALNSAIKNQEYVTNTAKARVRELSKEVEDLKESQGVQPIINAIGTDYDSIPFSTSTGTFGACESCGIMLLDGKCMNPLCDSKDYEPNDLI